MRNVIINVPGHSAYMSRMRRDPRCRPLLSRVDFIYGGVLAAGPLMRYACTHAMRDYPEGIL
eukprot:5752008-Prymnesium_polylepis.2